MQATRYLLCYKMFILGLTERGMKGYGARAICVYIQRESVSKGNAVLEALKHSLKVQITLKNKHIRLKQHPVKGNCRINASN